jgi:hypothetical protein
VPSLFENWLESAGRFVFPSLSFLDRHTIALAPAEIICRSSLVSSIISPEIISDNYNPNYNLPKIWLICHKKSKTTPKFTDTIYK